MLVEHPGSLRSLELTEELRAAGYEVITCSGPRAALPRPCPLLADERCRLVDAADVIVNGLHAEQDVVLERQRRMTPDTPVVLLEGADASTCPARSGGGVVAVDEMISGAELVTVLDQLVAGRERPVDEEAIARWADALAAESLA